MDRKKKLFLILLAVWGGLLIYRFVFFEGTRTAPMKYIKGAVSTSNKGEGEGSMKLRTELLKPEPASPLSETKNIFAPLSSPKPLPPPAPIQRPAPGLPAPPPSPVAPPPPPPEVRGPTPEELALAQARTELTEIRYLGFLDRGNGRQEGFFSKRQEALIAAKGAIVFGHFIVKELSGNLAVIEEAATHAEVTLQLAEGKNER